MSYDLDAVTGPNNERVSQFSWPPIWKWLNEQDGRLGEKAVDGGLFNDGHIVTPATARRFAQILRKNPTGGPATLNEDGRRERLIKFFESCGGFRIR
jgi:hypothetical protein